MKHTYFFKIYKLYGQTNSMFVFNTCSDCIFKITNSPFSLLCRAAVVGVETYMHREIQQKGLYISLIRLIFYSRMQIGDNEAMTTVFHVLTRLNTGQTRHK